MVIHNRMYDWTVVAGYITRIIHTYYVYRLAVFDLLLPQRHLFLKMTRVSKMSSLPERNPLKGHPYMSPHMRSLISIVGTVGFHKLLETEIRERTTAYSAGIQGTVTCAIIFCVGSGLPMETGIDLIVQRLEESDLPRVAVVCASLVAACNALRNYYPQLQLLTDRATVMTMFFRENYP